MTDTAPPIEAYEQAFGEPTPVRNGRIRHAPVHDADLELLIARIAIEHPDRLPHLLDHGLDARHVHQPGPRHVLAAAIGSHHAGVAVDRYTVRSQLPPDHADQWLAQVIGREIPSLDPGRLAGWVDELRRLHAARHTDDILDRANRARAAGEPLEQIQAVLAELEQATVAARGHDLTIESIADVAARVDLADPPGFLARPVWPADAYGVIAAEDKAGKSWAALDLAVAVASGARWLDEYPCDRPGPVLLFLGEGSDRKTIRRLRAVAEFHDATLEDLDIRVCHRAPNLTNAEHLARIRAELEQHPPRLVILDPAYLALGNTNTGLLAEMGQVLGALQYEVQAAGAALVVVHHWNKTGTGSDRKRMTGAGFTEWGRVLVSIAVDATRTTDGHDTIVGQTWKFIGDEIPDQTLTIERRVWSDDPDDLTSAMHYTAARPRGPHTVADDPSDDIADQALASTVTDVLTALGGVELTQSKLIAACREHGHSGRPDWFRRVFFTLAGSPESGIRMRITGSPGKQSYRFRHDPQTGIDHDHHTE